MTDKNETGQIYELIPKIMGDIGHIGKDQQNSFHKYAFRGIDDVYNCVGPILAKYGVFILPIIQEHQVTDVQTTQDKTACRVILKVAYRFTAPDGSYVEAVTIGESMDTGDKAASKAMSAAMKYAVWQTLCIPTQGAQGDIENDSHERAPIQQPTPPPAPDPIMAKQLECLEIYGKDLCAKAKLQLIGGDGQHLKATDKISSMGQANELRRILDAGVEA